MVLSRHFSKKCSNAFIYVYNDYRYPILFILLSAKGMSAMKDEAMNKTRSLRAICDPHAEFMCVQPLPVMHTIYVADKSSTFLFF